MNRPLLWSFYGILAFFATNRVLLTELISVMTSYLATNRVLLTELMLVLVKTGN